MIRTFNSTNYSLGFCSVREKLKTFQHVGFCLLFDYKINSGNREKEKLGRRESHICKSSQNQVLKGELKTRN
jgi:hypothetical protein